MKKTLLDSRFDKFVEAVAAAAKMKQPSLFIFGRSIALGGGNNSLETLMTFSLDGESFRLTDCLEDKARIASRGYLGHDLIEKGVRCEQAVLERLERERRSRAFEHLVRLYGGEEAAKAVWLCKNKHAHEPAFARLVHTVLYAARSRNPERAMTALEKRVGQDALWREAAKVAAKIYRRQTKHRGQQPLA